MGYTQAQQQAINAKGNTLVSAGAGSGKTAVLTQRVIKLITQDKLMIDNLLILTFTNAAAASMKEKITKRLLDFKDDPEISRNIQQLDTAQITTFDAFALSIVKRYYKQTICVMSQEMLTYLENRVINQVFEEYYQSDNIHFKNLIGSFVFDNDEDLKAKILRLKQSVDLLADEKEFFNRYHQIVTPLKIKQYMDELLENQYAQAAKSLTVSFQQISQLDIEQSYIDAIMQQQDLPYDQMNFEIPKVRNPQLKQYREILKQMQSDQVLLLEESPKLAEIEKELQALESHRIILSEIILKVIARLNDYMELHDSYSFNKVAKKGIELLRNNPDIVQQLKQQYLEIMIDEYQDTSDLQEQFIRYIANDNVFMVGDVKQSIYRFRNANPTIFKEKYLNYEKGIGGQKIDLLDNFRSRNAVIEGINGIFDDIMTLQVGGADYQQSHRMKASNPVYQRFFHDNHTMKVIRYDSEQVDEIDWIANDILDRYSQAYKVYENEAMRPIQLKDFAIITPDSTMQDAIYQKLTSRGLLVNVVGFTKVNRHPIMLTLRSLVRCLAFKNSNRELFKYALVSVARSFVAQIKDDEIARILQADDLSVFPFYDKIQQLLDEADTISLYQLIKNLIEVFDVTYHLTLLSDIELGLAIIHKFLQVAQEMSDLGETLSDFEQFLEAVYQEKINITLDRTSGLDDALTLINIHKSKGLEYKVCYFPYLKKKFNQVDVRSPFVFDKQLGFIVPIVEHKFRRHSSLKRLYTTRLQQEELSERIRLLYVALTRAQEEIVLLLPKQAKAISFDASYHGFLQELDQEANWVQFCEVNQPDEARFMINSKSIITNAMPYELATMPAVTTEIMAFEQVSKSINQVIAADLKHLLETGTKVHEILEWIDLKNPDYTLISPQYQAMVEGFVNCGLNFNEAQIYHEYEFVTDSYNGIIDLILEYADEIKIVDFKLSHIEDEAYVRQLGIYKEVLSQISDKAISCYLYSLSQKKLVRIH